MSTPMKKATAQSGKGKNGTDAGSEIKSAMKPPVEKLKKTQASSKTSKR